jgi:hypothetical protein
MTTKSSSAETTLGEQPVFPSLEEQEAYWCEQARKERDAVTKEQALKALDAFSTFLGELNTAIGKLRKEFEKLSKP